MKPSTYDLFATGSLEDIVTTIDDELQKRNESPFWADKVLPFSRAILSVLIPLRDEKRLFTPEGKEVDTLTPELFFAWSDFVSLKTLYFRVEGVELDTLGEYLHRYSVNLENEYLDFPISSYNLHQGVSNVIKSLL